MDNESKIISAKTLAERERKRIDIKKTIYKTILEQFSRKISNAASLGAHDIVLTTPRFVLGLPAYDTKIATDYLQRQLGRLGYTARRAMPYVIHVSWNKPVASNHVVVIDHSQDMPTLANLHKTAQTLRAKKR